jgi:hypothetical protein
MALATHILLLQVGQHWEHHWGPHGGPFFFPPFFGLFHAGFFWLAALGLFVFLRRSGRHRHPGPDTVGTVPGPEPPVAQRAGEEAQPWPALYPDEPVRQAQGTQELSPRGPVEYV